MRRRRMMMTEGDGEWGMGAPTPGRRGGWIAPGDESPGWNHAKPAEAG